MTQELLENTTEDSDGATEVASEETREDVPETERSESEGAETEVGEPELEAYDFGGFQASLDELTEWKEAYETQKSKNADYTQKTQKVSAQSKQAEAKLVEAESRLENLTLIESEIDKLVLGDLANIDLDKVLAEDGAEEHLKYQREIDKRKATKAVISQKIKKAQEAGLVESYKTLSTMLDWSDQDKQKNDVASINVYVKDVEMPLKDFNKVSDPYVMQAFLEAQKYRELIKKREQTSKKLKQAPKISKPSGAVKPAKQRTLAERMYGKK